MKKIMFQGPCKSSTRSSQLVSQCKFADDYHYCGDDNFDDDQVNWYHSVKVYHLLYLLSIFDAIASSGLEYTFATIKPAGSTIINQLHCNVC